MLIDALEFVLYNAYVQFGSYLFKHILGIPMGGNASPFIAGIYLAWNEYQFITLSKTNSSLAKQLTYNSRYLDDFAVVNLKDFSGITKNIYHHINIGT